MISIPTIITTVLAMVTVVLPFAKYQGLYSALWPTPVFLPGESIPWTEESGGIWSRGSHRVRHNWSDLAHTHIHSSPVGPFCRITSLFYEIPFSFDSPLTFDSSSFTGPLNAAVAKFYPWLLGSSVVPLPSTASTSLLWCFPDLCT